MAHVYRYAAKARPPGVYVRDPAVIGDYSSEPTDFFIEPAPDETYAIARLIVHLETEGTR